MTRTADKFDLKLAQVKQEANEVKKQARTVADKLHQLGKAASTVYQWLQNREDGRVREAVAINHSHLWTLKQVAEGTGLPQATAAGALVTLAQNGLLSRITPEGLVAA